MCFADVIGGLGNLGKLIANLELEYKSQATEIVLLRRENGELRKEIAGMAESLARLEEGRHTIDAQVEKKMMETITLWEMRRLQQENELLRRKQLSGE